MPGLVRGHRTSLFHQGKKDVDAPGLKRRLMTHFGYAGTAHTFSNGTLIALRLSSHSGTGRFLERMKSGLNSFD